MDQILDHLYLGCFEDVPLSSVLLTRIFSLCEQAPMTALPVTHVPIADEWYYMPSIWQGLVSLLALHLMREQTILVHCRLGVSRSPALVVAYLAQAQAMELEEALALVTAQRPCVNIHSETWRGIVAWDNQRKS